MPRVLRLAYCALSVIAVTLAAACAASTEPAAQPSPAQPRPEPSAANPMGSKGPAPKSECATDADCGVNMTCTAHIWSACDTCDGGPVYRTCDPR